MNNVTPIQPKDIEQFPELTVKCDFDSAETYAHGQLSKAVGLSLEFLTAGTVASFVDTERRLLRQGQVKETSGLRLRDYQIEALKGIIASLPLMKVPRKFKAVRTAKARNRKARRQALVKYSPAPFLWGGTVTGRLNRTGPNPRWVIPKPRTGMTDLIKKMNEGSLDV